MLLRKIKIAKFHYRLWTSALKYSWTIEDYLQVKTRGGNYDPFTNEWVIFGLRLSRMGQIEKEKTKISYKEKVKRVKSDPKNELLQIIFKFWQTKNSKRFKYSKRFNSFKYITQLLLKSYLLWPVHNPPDQPPIFPPLLSTYDQKEDATLAIDDGWMADAPST